jgi:ribosomal protein S18 acetylase RimI-like enzyme
METRRAEPGDAGAVIALMAGLGRPAAERPVRESGPVEGVRGNREVPPATRDTPYKSQVDVFRAHLDSPEAEIFLAELDGNIAGAVSLWFRPRLNWTTPEAWIPDLYVDPAFRRRGAARALLDACVAAARERGCHRLVLESGHERAEAHLLYESYGFTHGGRFYALRLS